MKYWAIDYVNGEMGECELVCDDQLYATEEEAQAVLDKLPRPDLHEITWYTFKDLQELYHCESLEIDDKLKVYCNNWAI